MAGRFVIGIGLILVGAVFLVGLATDLDAADVVAKWWPLILVALGVVQFAIDRRAAVGSLMLAVVGLLLLAFTTGVVTGSVWAVLWPTLLILAGIALVTPRIVGPPETAGDTVRGFVIFGVRHLVSRSGRLRGGELTAILGSLELDLTEATPTRDARLAVTSLFGACEIVVPHGWEVQISGIPLLGLWDDTTQRNGLPAGAPVLRVSAFVLLGALEIRHPDQWK